MKGKTHLVVLVGGVAAAVLIALCAVLLIGSMARLNTAKRNLARKRNELNGYFKQDPFPSEDNVKREKQNVEALRSWLQVLLENISAGQMGLEERSPSTFMGLLGEVRRQLKASAVKSSVTVPSDFAFGFGHYFREGSSLPAPDHVPRLMQQLTIVTNLCGILFEEGIADLTQMDREEFDVTVDTRRAQLKDAQEVLAQAGLMGEDDLYAKLHFVLEFKAKERALVAVLNRLASHQMFAVVTKLGIVRDSGAVRIQEGVELQDGQELSKEEIVKKYEELPRTARTVAGLGVEKPMKVTLELDVYRFRKD